MSEILLDMMCVPGWLRRTNKRTPPIRQFWSPSNLGVSNYQGFEKILIARDGGALGHLASSVRQAGFWRIG